MFESKEATNKAVAEFIIAIAEQSIKTNGKFTLSLSGGQTPANLYKLMSDPQYSSRMPWQHTFIFWGDERCVPSDDKRNNANMAKALLLDHISIPSININAIPVELEPRKAAEEYESTIKQFFGEEQPSFDLILLGLGENGHTASLFPGTDVVFENKRLVKELYVTDQNMFRITMTPLLINKAHNIIFLVEGKNKAEILNEVLSPEQADKFPAQVIKPKHGNLYWFVDEKAAAFLPINMRQQNGV
ncbi:MAG: 6-phosphogluconolactonase [Saprospiraceae bacterium]